MNINKSDVLFLLSKHPGKWLKTKSIAKELKLSTTEGINRISNILYRLRKLQYIERRNNSHDYEYCCIDDKTGHPTILRRVSKSESDQKARGDSDVFEFIEPIEPEENLCELCDLWCKVTYQAEKNGCRVFLCKKHGNQINKTLCGYGGVF